MNHQHLQAFDTEISWSDLYFTAEASREKFEEVSVVTLKSDFIDKVYDFVAKSNVCVTSKEFERRVTNLINANQVSVYERVEVSKDGIYVVISRDTIDDQAVVDSLQMVSTALNQLNGEYGVIRFGNPVTFLSTEISWLYRH